MLTCNFYAHIELCTAADARGYIQSPLKIRDLRRFSLKIKCVKTYYFKIINLKDQIFDRNRKFLDEILGVTFDKLGFQLEIFGLSKICGNRVPYISCIDVDITYRYNTLVQFIAHSIVYKLP